MFMHKEGFYRIMKEGNRYLVYRKRRIVGKFLLLNEAIFYIDIHKQSL